MGSSNLESFLSKDIIFSTNNRFSTLLNKSGKVIPSTLSTPSKTNSSSKKDVNSIQVIQAFKAGKNSL